MAISLNGVLQVIQVLTKLIPPPKAPVIDYSLLRQSTPDYSKLFIVPAPPLSLPECPNPVITADTAGEKKGVATSCMACSRSHLTTISGALDEALRFARKDGVDSDESMRRIDAAEREINIMERIDLSPESIQNSPREEQEFIEPFMQKIRELRQNIGQIKSVQELERTAAQAIEVSREFKQALMRMEKPSIVKATEYHISSVEEPVPDDDKIKSMEAYLRRLQANGVNLNPVIQLAKRVKRGEISLEKAREEVRTLLPGSE